MGREVVWVLGAPFLAFLMQGVARAQDEDDGETPPDGIDVRNLDLRNPRSCLMDPRPTSGIWAPGWLHDGSQEDEFPERRYRPTQDVPAFGLVLDTPFRFGGADFSVGWLDKVEFLQADLDVTLPLAGTDIIVGSFKTEAAVQGGLAVDLGVFSFVVNYGTSDARFRTALQMSFPAPHEDVVTIDGEFDLLVFDLHRPILRAGLGPVQMDLSAVAGVYTARFRPDSATEFDSGPPARTATLDVDTQTYTGPHVALNLKAAALIGLVALQGSVQYGYWLGDLDPNELRVSFGAGFAF